MHIKQYCRTSNLKLSRIVVLCCCFAFQACTSVKSIYPTESSAAVSSWVQNIKVGDTLEVLLKGESAPVTLKVADINAAEIKGEDGVSVALVQVESIQKRHYSWLKNSFLVLGIILVGGAITVKNSLDDMGELDLCVAYGCGGGAK